MSKTDQIVETAEQIEQPVTIPVEAYLSEDYARAERDKLWRKVWLQAGRVEEIPAVGDYLTYEILDDSVIIVRTAPEQIRAYHNVCAHRGRRLVDVPKGARNARGRAGSHFVCNYHGWAYNLNGENTHIVHKEQWQGRLTPECTGLAGVNVDTWGGWIWVNLDPDCEPLRDYLEPAAAMLDPFELHRMRCRWRKWVVFDCNWKVALEAFNEIYHVQSTHPEFNQFGKFLGWAKVQGKHSNIGYDAPKDMDENKGKVRLGEGDDPRVATAQMQNYIWEYAQTNTTQTLVDAANRLADELPEGTPPDKVLRHWIDTARADDAAKGVVWASVDPEHVGESGTAWQIFPNFQIGHGINNMLCYSARPCGYNPDKCYFEASVYQLYPEGQEPQAPWQYAEPTEEGWNYVLAQDFSNMAAVQQGMKSMAFSGPKPNPQMERTTANFHRNLAKYMGTGHPKKL